MKREIPWPRILAEGTAIVASILLAFAIDAWWDDHKEAERRQAQLQTLLGEFVDARDQLRQQLEGMESSLRGTLTVLELLGTDAAAGSGADVRAAVAASMNEGLSAPQVPSLSDVLASGAPVAAGANDLRSMLQAWSVMMADLDIDAEHLESNREKDFMDALIRLGVPLLGVIPLQGDSRLQLPDSKFDTNLADFLADPGVETVFAMRVIRSQVLINQHRRAIDLADTIVDFLEART